MLRQLEEYHRANGKYPARLVQMDLHLKAADGADVSTLGFVRYSSDEQSFTYAEIGPDEFHHRVWWCAGAETCGHLDLRDER